TGKACRGHPQAEGNSFDLDRIRSHEAERQAVLGDTHDGLAIEGFREKKIKCEGEQQTHHAWHTQTERDANGANGHGSANVWGLDQAVINAVGQDQGDLSNKEEPEEKDQPT